MSLAADLTKLSDPSILGGLGGQANGASAPSIQSERKVEITYAQNYQNYDQRRAESNVSINALTNGSGGANGRVDFEGNNNALGQIRT